VKNAYPLLLDVTRRLIVIVGGGSVAVRKAQGLIQAGATQILCVAPIISDQMPREVRQIKELYQPRHIQGAMLVFAATDQPHVNAEIVRQADRLGILVNRADTDEDEPGDFITPAVWREGEIMLLVSAGGNPALAARLRDELASAVDPAMIAMARQMQELRPLIRQLPDINLRREVFRVLAGREACTILTRDGPAGLRRWLIEKYAPLTSVLNVNAPG
jgi:precorrin-2 dehydrogenase / sirohydrochlorin ferrochelatase